MYYFNLVYISSTMANFFTQRLLLFPMVLKLQGYIQIISSFVLLSLIHLNTTGHRKTIDANSRDMLFCQR